MLNNQTLFVTNNTGNIYDVYFLAQHICSSFSAYAPSNSHLLLDYFRPCFAVQNRAWNNLYTDVYRSLRL